MRNKLLGILAAGAAFSLVISGQSAAEPAASQVSQPDPLLAFLPPEAQIDWASVHRNRESRKQSRTKVRTAGQPLAYGEKEAVGTQGGNDTPASAEYVAGSEL